MTEPAKYSPQDLGELGNDISISYDARRAIYRYAGAWRAERAIVGQFVRSLYVGRIEEHAILYDTLPGWLKDAIEGDEVYK